MGWLGGETTVSVATAVSRVIKDTLLPNAVRTGTFRAILRDSNIPQELLQETAGSLGLRAERMHDFALHSYPYGRPDANLLTGAFAHDEITARLSLLEGAAVTLDYSHFGAANALHTAWMRLVADWGYNPVTNELATLSAAKGKPVYLQDLQVMAPAAQVGTTLPANTLAQWGRAAAAGPTPFRSYTEEQASTISPTEILVNGDITGLAVRMTAVWNDAVAPAAPHAATETHDIAVDTPDPAEDYAHVKYRVGSTIKYWSYLVGSGTYPEIDAVFTSGSQMGSFFPMAYFRFDGIDQSADQTTPEYKASRRLVKYLGMDYAATAQEINANPDIANVRQAIMVMAVPANTDVPVELRYLFDFYAALYEATPSDDRIAPPAGVTTGGWGAPLPVPMSSGLVLIQDQRFRMALSNAGLYKYRVTGTIGPKGTYSRSSASANLVITQVINTDTGETADVVYPRGVHVYRHQVSATEYDEIAVVDMRLRYYIFGRYGVTASDTEDILLVPLDRNITRQYPLTVREQLYARSLHFVFNAVVFTHVSWYQSFEFQFVMAVAAVVMTIINIEAGSAVWTLIEAGATDLALLLIEHLVLQFVLVTTALKLFERLVGPELALVIAVIVAAWGAYESISTGSLPGAPFAEDLLRLASGLAKAVAADLQDDFAALAKEYESFNVFRQERVKELEEANKLLEHQNWLSPFTIFGEKPEDFFNRTVHSGNIGVLGIGAISNYVDTALRLPKLADTIGDHTYGI